jgi:predicted neuraminidase
LHRRGEHRAEQRAGVDGDEHEGAGGQVGGALLVPHLLAGGRTGRGCVRLHRGPPVAVPESTGCVHMNIQPLADGTLLALFRSRWADHVYESRSADDGLNWSAPVPTELPNNNSSIQFVRLRDDRLALVFNESSAADATECRASLYDEIDDDGLARADDQPLPEPTPNTGHTAFWGAPRAPMTLALSDDGGRTWAVRRNLEVGDGYCLTNNSRDGLNREFSYPSVHRGPDGALSIAFTYFRQAIKYVRVDPDWAAAKSP